MKCQGVIVNKSMKQITHNSKFMCTAFSINLRPFCLIIVTTKHNLSEIERMPNDVSLLILSLLVLLSQQTRNICITFRRW